MPKNWIEKSSKSLESQVLKGSTEGDINEVSNYYCAGQEPWNFFKHSIEITRLIPSIDIEETEQNIVVKADIPGLKRDDIKIILTNCSFIIQGQIQSDQTKASKYFLHERSYGSFYRNIALPCQVEKKNANIHLSKGVLNIILPKKKILSDKEH